MSRLTLRLNHETVYLSPCCFKESQTISGLIDLHLPANRMVGMIRLNLKGIEEILLTGFTSAGKTPFIDQIDHVNVGHLTKGHHQIPFAIKIPTDCPPSMNNKISRCNYMLEATLPKYKRQSAVTSKIPVHIIVNLGGEADLPAPLMSQSTRVVDELGILHTSVIADHLQTSCFADLHIKLVPSSSDAFIDSVAVRLIESYCLSPEPKSSMLDRDPPLSNMFPLYSQHVSMSSIRNWGKLQANKEWLLEKHMRLPDCNMALPTTHCQTLTRVRISHRIVVVVSWRARPGAILQNSVTTIPVDISSCYCMPEHLNLPAYSHKDPHPSNFLARSIKPKSRRSCLCGFTNEQLMQRAKVPVQEEIAPAVVLKDEE